VGTVLVLWFLYDVFDPLKMAGFEFQTLPGMRWFQVYGTLEFINERTMHQGWFYVKKWMSVPYTDLPTIKTFNVVLII
jgi:hypothetical protein